MNLATVGSGSIVEKFLYAVSRTEGLCCTAVCSRRPESGALIAGVNEKYSGRQDTKIYTDFEELLRDDTISIIYIALPNSLHFEYARKALSAGKHVVGEKPFTVTAAETEELIRLSQERRLFLFEAVTTRYLPNYLEIMKYIPKLGRIRLIQCNFSQYSSRYDAFLAGEVPNVFNPEFAGGALYDLNIYNLHFVCGLFGLPEKEWYIPNLAYNGIDTSGTAVLQYDGYQAVCTAAKDSASPNFAMIQGEKGCIYVKGPTSRCLEWEISVDGSTEYYNVQTDENVLIYEAACFDRIIREGQYDECTRRLADSLAVMQLLERLG